MIVLDTNVLSALMRREADPAVVAWLDLQPSESVWTTAVTVFQGRILPFDHEAAQEAASRAAQRREAGKPVDFRDVEIAGIVSARRATLATRNARHFHGLRIELVDPWARR